MIGTRFESFPSLPIVSIGLGVGWVMALAVAWSFGDGYNALAAAPVGAFAIVRWLYRERPFRMEIESQGLLLESDHQAIPYAEIRSVINAKPNIQGPQFPIKVIHQNGTFVIPSSIDHPSDALLEFLQSKLAPRTWGYIHPALQNHLKEQLELFGLEKVFCFSPREMIEPGNSGTVIRMVGLVLLFTGLLWGLVTPFSESWIIPTIIMGVFGGMFVLASYARRDRVTPHAKNWQESTLLITPTGIALMQGKLKGKLRWDEIVSVKLTGAPRFSITPVIPGLVIQVTGSQITILDIYNDSLPGIHQSIMGYYEGRSE